MIYILALYSNTSQQDCYSQMTQLNLLNNSLQVLFNRVPNIYCDFPSGVMVQLQFPNSNLNIGKIFTNFSFNDTNQLEIPCESCEKYNDIIEASVLIDSPQLTSLVSIGSILNVKKQDKMIQKGVIFNYTPEKACVVIDLIDFGKNLADKEVKLVVESYLLGSATFSDFNVIFDANSTSYCFSTNITIDFVNTAKLHISGLENGILVSETFLTSKTIIANQPSIISGIQSTVYNNFFFLKTIPINPAYDDFINTINTENVTFVAQFLINSQNYFITGKLDPKLLKTPGNIICDATNDPKACKMTMELVKSQHITDRHCTFFFHFGSQILVQNVTIWTASCFNTLEIEVRQASIELFYTFEVASMEMCKLTDSEEVVVKVGYFESEDRFVDAISGFTTVQSFPVRWDGQQNQLSLKIGKNQYKKFADLRDFLYKGIFITDLDGEFLDYIQGEVQVNLQIQMLSYVSLCIVISVLLVILAYSLMLIPRRARRQKIAVKDDIGE